MNNVRLVLTITGEVTKTLKADCTMYTNIDRYLSLRCLRQNPTP